MTTIHMDPDAFKLEMSGHAGADEKGKDIVCAGASILGFALLNAAKDREDFHADVYMDWNDAAIMVECHPEKEAEAECREMFRVVMHGYAVLLQGSPDHIQIFIEGD